MNIVNGIMHIYLSQPDAVCINITGRIVLGSDRRQPTQDVALNSENMPKVQNTISCHIKLRIQKKKHIVTPKHARALEHEKHTFI